MKNLIYRFYFYVRILIKDIKDRFPISFYLKLKLLSNGFLSEKYTLYRLDKYPWDLFLSDYDTSISRYINEPYNEIISNKYIFSKLVNSCIKVPCLYGVVLKGTIYFEGHHCWEDLKDNKSSLVLKPVSGGGGKGVYILKPTDNVENFLLNFDRIISFVELTKMVGKLDNYILTEYINPGKFSSSLNPKTINTLRVLTLIDPYNGKPFIARAVHRIGVNKSFPMDNFTKGGLSSIIDIDSGRLGKATAHPKDTNFDYYEAHPDNGLVFYNKLIPNWDDVKKKILHLASSLSVLKAVGWDLILTDEDVFAIEGNHHADPDVLQCHGPLLDDKKIKRFYKYYGIIK